AAAPNGAGRRGTLMPDVRSSALSCSWDLQWRKSPPTQRFRHMSQKEEPPVNTPRNTPPDRATFENAYAGKAPSDIGKPQRPFVAAANRVTSPVLDAGCGTGDTALFFAERGHRVTGIDFVEEPIRRARLKAGERGLSVEFLVKDALTLSEWGERFASV